MYLCIMRCLFHGELILWFIVKICFGVWKYEPRRCHGGRKRSAELIYLTFDSFWVTSVQSWYKHPIDSQRAIKICVLCTGKCQRIFPVVTPWLLCFVSIYVFCFNIRDLLLRSLSIVCNVHVSIYYYYRILVLYLGQIAWYILILSFFNKNFIK